MALCLSISLSSYFEIHLKEGGLEIHLEDCSSRWFDWVIEAKDSVVVFTPYFDQLLIDIFEESTLPKSEITLVTQLDWGDNNSKTFNKVRNILKMNQMGIEVRILDRLHAKILIADWDRAIFGSQNFTNYSTGSVEISCEVDRYGDNFDEAFKGFESLLSDSRRFSLSDLH